ncbi:MAG: class I SAM-dependent methyltransferase [Planctomycetes bacterium]|nr:class I SAM-dependent methyltransferase [Planctomycetota bacterium]
MNNMSPIQDHALETMSDSESQLVEDRLWWMCGRKAIIRKYLEKARQSSSISTIMDIGCGSGGNLEVLKEFGNVIGVERSETLACRASNRGIADAIFQQDALELDECRNIELFTMFDVLEHIEDDKGFLVQLRKKAAQKHRILISVPACEFLYGDHDRILHHHRRYTNKTLRFALEEAGYQVMQTSHFMVFLLPLVLLARLKDKIMAKFGRKRTTIQIGDFPSILSVPFSASLRIEAFLSQKVRFPIGVWLFALAESNDQSQSPNNPDAGNNK